MGSRRLPGKVLMPLAGRALLDHLLERLSHVTGTQELVVATSTEPADDPIAAHCRDCGVDCHRGPHDDVAGRLLAAATERGWDAVARVNGDSPLHDQRIVDRAIALISGGGVDLATNVFPQRTFPAGQSVEVIARASLERAHHSMSPEEREHVTPFYYEHPESFEISSFALDPPVRDIRFTVDEQADADRLERLIEALPAEHWRIDLSGILEAASRLGLRDAEATA